MKKILSSLMTLILVLSVFCSGALAESAELVGEWYASLYGVTMILTLKEDGVYIMRMDMEGEEPDEGTWAFDGTALVMDKGSEDEVTLAYDSEAVSLSAEVEGMEMLFLREMPIAFEAAPARFDATLEEFAGAWVCTLVDVMGMQAPPEIADIDLGLKIDGTSVTMTITEFSDPVESVLDGIFADGTLTATITAESEYSEDAVFALQLLEDGTMSVTSSFLGEPVVYYMSLAEIDE